MKKESVSMKLPNGWRVEEREDIFSPYGNIDKMALSGFYLDLNGKTFYDYQKRTYRIKDKEVKRI